MLFNLMDEPWLPCLAPDGRRCELGIRDALAQAHELACLRDGSPLVTAALHRLLLAILHRAVEGPKDEKDWARLWRRGQFDAPEIGRYLDAWRQRFDLFDAAHPFCQVARFEVGACSPAAQLAQELSRGNNPVLFDHTVEDDAPPVSPPEAARRLVGNQVFALGGGVGATSNLFGKHPNLTHAPLAGGVTALLAGDTLFETLMLNLLVYSPEASPGGRTAPPPACCRRGCPQTPVSWPLTAPYRRSGWCF